MLRATRLLADDRYSSNRERDVMASSIYRGGAMDHPTSRSSEHHLRDFRVVMVLGAIFGFLAVAFGAFGAHALRDRMSPPMLEVYRTGVSYQMFHSLAILVIGALAVRARSTRLALTATWLFAAGIVLFSGSLYVLAVSGIRGLGAITPFGGVCFLAGWALFAAWLARNPEL